MVLSLQDHQAILAGFTAAGYVCTQAPTSVANPIKIKWHHDGEVELFRLWAFDITHGGGGPTVRAADEFRVQITNGPNSMGALDTAGAVDLLVGYSRDRDAIVAYDRRWLENWITKKESTGSRGSPSVQVKEADIQAGHDKGIHHLTKDAGFGRADIVTMRPSMLPAFLLNHESVLKGTMAAEQAEAAMSRLDLPTVVDYCRAQGFPFEPDLLARYIASLLAKPFVILAGVSGTGKSKLAELVAEFYTLTAKKQPDKALASHAWLLSWNPKNWTWTSYAEDRLNTIKGQTVVLPWRINNTHVVVGDRVYLVRSGDEPRGIIARGTVKSAPYQTPHYDAARADAGEMQQTIDVGFDDIRDPQQDGFLKPSDLGKLSGDQHWTPQASGIAIRSDVIAPLEDAWSKLAKPILQESASSSGLREQAAQFTSATVPYSDMFVFTAAKGGAIGNPDRSRFALVPVRPDWIDNQSILGFVNPITDGYESTQALDLILRAKRALDSSDEMFSAPRHFMLLDEMNLARVEHYFSDWLACTESRRLTPSGHIMQQPVALHRSGKTMKTALQREDGTTEDAVVPRSLELPTNLVVTGTVNVDETTYGFSPKVLDRAMVLEFDEVDLDRLSTGEPVAAATGYTFPDVLPAFRLATLEDYKKLPSAVHGHLKAINAILEEGRLHFGYRAANEIALFMSIYNSMLPLDPADGDWLRALDAAVLQKVLPRISGNRAKVEAPLMRLCAYLRDLAVPADAGQMPEINSPAQLSKSYRRAVEMLGALVQFGFVSFFK